MSSDYYFKKWRQTLTDLKGIVELDTEYQVSEVHDADYCDAVQRLTGVLSRYIVCYNNAVECVEQNLQIQKMSYYKNITKSIVHRILELKGQIRKLEGNYHLFLTNALIEHKLTTNDAELSRIPEKHERPATVQTIIDKAFDRAREMKDSVTEKQEEELTETEEQKWWEVDTTNTKEEKHTNKLNVTEVYEVKVKISKETTKRRNFIALIQAHERSRQVIRVVTRQKLKKEMWQKELMGTLQPSAPVALRQRAAQIIQTVLRAYFKLKRDKLKECKLDELLNVKLCQAPDRDIILGDELKQIERPHLYEVFEEQCKRSYEEFKWRFMEKHADEISENYREYVREWFLTWYNETKYFHKIPNVGGCLSVLKEDVPSPAEWTEKYKTYLEQKKLNKNKTTLQIKWEKMEAKREEAMFKMEELNKKRAEEKLKREIMKNPKKHPGYKYPKSKRTKQLQQEINIYIQNWFNMDEDKIDGVKEKCVYEVTMSDACMDAKMDICKGIDEQMRSEYKILMKSLKMDYDNNDEKLPEEIKEKRKKRKVKRTKKTKETTKLDANTGDALTYLIENGFIVQYNKIKIQRFTGDSNFAGSNLRCQMKEADHFGAEIRDAWWEKCLEVFHGSQRILLVGGTGSGKTTLAHTMATLTDAVLYVLDPSQMNEESLSPLYLDQLVKSVARCAKLTQPSIIYLRHVHKLFYSKVPSQEDKSNLTLLKRYFVRRLFKRIQKHNSIVIIGSCVDPWLTKSTQLLKKFPSVLLLPHTSYSALSLLFRDWILKNRIVPTDLDVHALSYMLRGYSYGYLVEKLSQFLSPAQIVRIAAHGLRAEDVYDFIVKDGEESKIDYKKYLKWYNEKTYWGKLGQKKLNERIEFKQAVEKWNRKQKKRKSKPTDEFGR